MIKNIYLSTQGFKQHALHDVLESPGSADLTADVDFGAIKRAVLTEGIPSSIKHASTKINNY